MLQLLHRLLLEGCRLLRSISSHGYEHASPPSKACGGSPTWSVASEQTSIRGLSPLQWAYCSGMHHSIRVSMHFPLEVQS